MHVQMYINNVSKEKKNSFKKNKRRQHWSTYT